MMENNFSFLYKMSLGNIPSPPRSRDLPLAKQAELASNALLLTTMLELLNDIENFPDTITQVDENLINDSIQLIERLENSEGYLERRRDNLIPRPREADTVSFIKERSDIVIRDFSKKVIEILKCLKSLSKKQPEISDDLINFVKDFLRVIHAGIIDQLDESYDDIDQLNV